MHSQTDTKKDSVTLRFYTAYRMHLDLIDYDRLVLNQVESNLSDCLTIGTAKDSIMGAQASTIGFMQKRLDIKDEKYRLIQLKYDAKTDKGPSGFIWGISGVSAGILLTLLLTK